MKIAFISTLSHQTWGGSEQLWHQTAILAAKSGHKVIVIVYKNDPIPSKISELTKYDIKIVFWNRFDSKNESVFTKIKYYIKRKYYRPDSQFGAIYKFNPEVICISHAGTFDIAQLSNKGLQVLVEKLNKPYIFICNNNVDVGFVPEINVRERMRKYFLQAKTSLFSSHRNYQVVERQLCASFKNFKTTSNPLTVKEISIKAYPDDETISFAEVAALECSHKGQDILLNVLSSDKWKNRNWILNFYGSGGDEAYLKELTLFYKLNDRVFFNGYVSHFEEIWENNHIFLLPSLGEGLPITLQDAILCGRTSVVTDVGGNSELVIDNETGFLCPAPTVKLFDETLERAWQNKHKWKEMGEKAFHLAKNKIDLNPEKTLLDIILS